MTNDDIKAITNERGSQYGDFNVQGSISQQLKDVARKSPNWNKMDAAKKEGIDMILHKISRILCGNPNHEDSWVDVEGYASIVRERLEK